MKLQDQVAVVTGGGRDIGRMTAVKLASMGAAVVVNYHSSASGAEKTVAMIKDQGGRAIAVRADVTSAKSLAEMRDRTISTFGDKIHVIVNNAGGLLARKTIAEMDEDFWDQVMNLNLKSVFLMCKTYWPHMADGGAIVNLSSLAARNGGGGGAIAYSAAKGAVLTMTRGLAKEFKSKHVRVNCVSPGMINTTFHDTFTPQEARKNTAAATLAGREGSAEDVANAIAFLACDDSSYINGESLEINGGLYFV